MKVVMQADDFGRSHEMNLAIDHAMKQGLVCSTALLMGSDFTEEAIEMADRGGYLQHVHCHLNLSSGANVGNHFVPLSEEYKNSRFCKDGEFGLCNYVKPDFQRYTDVVLKELETQFLCFREKTDGKANYRHLDVHRWVNFSLPVDSAYRRLISKYGIESARFFGEHHRLQSSIKKKIFYAFMISSMKQNKAYIMKSSRIDFFLAYPDSFEKESVFELYVHPDYREGILVDTTPSSFGSAQNAALEERIGLVRDAGVKDFIPWESL